MPDNPDFAAMAEKIARYLFPTDPGESLDPYDVRRQAWNARDAADAQAIERRVQEVVAGEVIGAGIARHAAAAIQNVDR